NDFGTDWAPSCYQCHEEEWNVGGANPAPTMSDLTGVVDQTVTFDASHITDPEGDPIAFQWDFGDGSPDPFPSHDPVTTHTYTDYGTFVATLAVTDGTHPPDYVSFNVVIADAATEPVADTWTVTPTVVPAQPVYDITFENHSGSLVGWADLDGDPDTPDQLSFGVEFVGVIFWMEMWMDLSGNVFWGTGDMYFGNVVRGEPGTMDGVLFKEDGTMGTFSATGGAPPEH
ncbi:MAG: PKD domain-containing protein, partial [Phycisphaerae bacterium]